MTDIFISYAQEDKDRAQALAQALESRGWTVFWDRHILPGQHYFDKVFSETLSKTRCVMVLWSATSVASDWVKEEAAEGYNRGILIPVLIDEVAIPLPFRRLQPADLIGWQGESQDPRLESVADAVSSILQPPFPAMPASASPVEACPVETKKPTSQKKSSLPRDSWFRKAAGAAAKALGAVRARFSSSHSSASNVVPFVHADNVHFSVTSPPSVAQGTSFVVDIWAHLEEQRHEVIERARESLRSREINIKTKGPVHVARGTTLFVRLKVDELIINDPEDIILWEGEIGNATFSVLVPKDAEDGTRVGLATIHIDGLQIAKLHFDIQVGQSSEELDYLPVRAHLHRKAFASYASPDRDEVLARIQGILKAAPYLDIFMDVLSFRSGQLWDQELWDIIPTNDIFYLFWSDHASKSVWVEKEWRCALQTKGIDFIDPVPLVSPEEVPPPQELARKHFNDWVLAFMSGKERRKSSPSHL